MGGYFVRAASWRDDLCHYGAYPVHVSDSIYRLSPVVLPQAGSLTLLSVSQDFQAVNFVCVFVILNGTDGGEKSRFFGCYILIRILL